MNQSLTHTFSHGDPKLMDGIGKIIPVFKDMFQDLEDFFDGVSKQVPPAN